MTIDQLASKNIVAAQMLATEKRDLLGIIRDLRDALQYTRVMVACYEIGKRPGDTILDGYQKGPDAITRAGEVLRGVGQ
jgi:hypothetical protein